MNLFAVLDTPELLASIETAADVLDFDAIEKYTCTHKSARRENRCELGDCAYACNDRFHRGQQEEVKLDLFSH